MKWILLIPVLFCLVSCKNESKPELKPVVEIDLSNNDIIHLEDSDGNYTNLETILERHKGKMIYIDYWASWCRPCRAEMPSSRELKKKYAGKDVVFIYISVDRDSKAWEVANKQEQLKEESYLALNYPKGKLYQLRNVSNIPRYMLYGKNGKMIDDAAIRPSNQRLTTILDGFLSL